MLIVDRFEGDWAVIEYGTTTFNLPRFLLPPDIKEGDVITLNVLVDQTLTNERRQKAAGMMKGFFDK